MAVGSERRMRLGLWKWTCGGTSWRGNEEVVVGCGEVGGRMGDREGQMVEVEGREGVWSRAGIYARSW